MQTPSKEREDNSDRSARGHPGKRTHTLCSHENEEEIKTITEKPVPPVHVPSKASELRDRSRLIATVRGCQAESWQAPGG